MPHFEIRLPTKMYMLNRENVSKKVFEEILFFSPLIVVAVIAIYLEWTKEEDEKEKRCAMQTLFNTR